jgi:hypothetical protein
MTEEKKNTQTARKSSPKGLDAEKVADLILKLPPGAIKNLLEGSIKLERVARKEGTTKVLHEGQWKTVKEVLKLL